jgi:hypothetical protein
MTREDIMTIDGTQVAAELAHDSVVSASAYVVGAESAATLRDR